MWSHVKFQYVKEPSFILVQPMGQQLIVLMKVSKEPQFQYK